MIEEFKPKLQVLADEAINEISQLSAPVIQFCGPISTGGFGNAQENLDFLISAIDHAKRTGMSVFDQVKYERRLDLILGKKDGYDYPILDFFYKPILSSGKVTCLILLPLWHTSTGTMWEQNYAKSLNIPVYYLEDTIPGKIEEIYKTITRDC